MQYAISIPWKNFCCCKFPAKAYSTLSISIRQMMKAIITIIILLLLLLLLLLLVLLVVEYTTH